MNNEQLLISKKIKENINIMIQNGNLEEAEFLLHQYENANNSDIEIYSIKAVIYIMKGRFNEAKTIINKGLEIHRNNFDLNYNLGYIYYNNKQYELGVQYYTKAYMVTDNEEIKKNIKLIIKEMSSELNLNEDVEVFLEGNIVKNEDVNAQRCLVLCHFYSVYTKEFLEKIYSKTNIKFDILTMDSSYKEKVKSGIIKNVYTYNDLNKINQILNSSESYDIIHIHFLTPFYGEITEQIRKKCNKLIVTIWGSDFYRTTAEQKEQQRKLVDKADIITFDNDVTMDDFAKYYGIVNKEKLSINRFGLTALEYIKDFENKDCNHIRSEYNIPENSIVVTCGYNANPAHNHLEIIKSIKQMKNKLPQNMYYIFPMTYSRDEKYCDIVKKELSQSGLKYIILEEFMNFEQIAKLTKITDIMVQLQTTDTLSATMQEHMYHGNIIITGSWLPYKPLKQVGAYFLEVFSVDRIGSKLISVVKELPVVKQRCKKNKNIIWNFSAWENTVESWIENYSQETIKIENISDRKKVLVIAYFFPPLGGAGVQRTLKYVKYLRDFGWEPIVVTVGNSNYFAKDATLMSEIPEGVKIVRIDDVTNEELNNEFLNKLVKFYSNVVNNDGLMNEYINELNKSNENLQQLAFIPNFYSAWGCKVLNCIENKVNFDDIDLIYTTASPECDHIIGYHLKKIYNLPWVVDFRDEWTNNPYVSYNTGSIKYKLERSMENNIVNLADKIITITSISTNNYISIFNLNDNKVKTITNGYDENDFEGINVNSKIKNNKFTVIHNGLFYGLRSPITFLTALKNLVNNGLIDKNKIKVCFTRTSGDAYLKEFVNNNNLNEVVKCLEYLNHKESLKLCNQSNLLLLVIGSGGKCKSVFTGKIFEYLRLNKPILALAPKDGVVDELLKETKRGTDVEYDDIKGIEEELLYYYEKWNKDNYETYKVDTLIQNYERKRLTMKLAKIFDEFVIGKKKIFDIIIEIEKQIDHKNYAVAESSIKKYLNIENNNFYLFYLLGKLYKHIGSYNEALDAFYISKSLCKNEESFNKINLNINFIKAELNITDRVQITLIGNENNNEFVKNIIKYDFRGNIRCLGFKENEDLNKYSYDDSKFIIYTDESNNNFKTNVYKYKDIYNKLQPEILNYKIMKLFNYNKIDILITGLSYYEVGLREELFDLQAFNIALSGQDLHYDYLMFKYLIDNYKMFRNLKYIVIGLSYYSFNYDLSNTNSKLCIHRYFNYIKDSKCFYDKNESKLTNLVYLTKFNYYEEVNSRLVKSLMKVNDLDLGYRNYLMNEAEKQASMNHINTVKENMKILKEMLELAKCKNIRRKLK